MAFMGHLVTAARVAVLAIGLSSLTMKFASTVFRVAAVWGVLVLAPLFFMFDGSGVTGNPPFTYLQAYFGFLCVTLAWQLAFWVIGSDPVRFRPLMVPAMVEKFGFVLALTVLYMQGRVGPSEVLPAVPDFVLGALFVAAYAKTR
jgi:hypothetical protein